MAKIGMGPNGGEVGGEGSKGEDRDSSDEDNDGEGGGEGGEAKGQWQRMAMGMAPTELSLHLAKPSHHPRCRRTRGRDGGHGRGPDGWGRPRP